MLAIGESRGLVMEVIMLVFQLFCRRENIQIKRRVCEGVVKKIKVKKRTLDMQKIWGLDWVL